MRGRLSSTASKMFTQFPSILLLVTLVAANGLSYTAFTSEEDDYDVLDPRIVGGRDAEEGEVPYQLALIDKRGVLICGASLVVSPRSGMQFAITAASCFTEFLTSYPNVIPEDYYVYGGSINRRKGHYLQLSQFVLHNKWGTGDDYFLNDIALLFFHGRFKLSNSLQPIKLPKSWGGNGFKEVLVSGWGSQKYRGHWYPDILKMVKLSVMPVEDCNRYYQEYLHGMKERVIYSSQLCVLYTEGGRDDCHGDPGGPAVTKDERGVVLVGIVGYGLNCNYPEVPGVYTRVQKFLPWIRYQVKIQENNVANPNAQG